MKLRLRFKRNKLSQNEVLSRPNPMNDSLGCIHFQSLNVVKLKLLMLVSWSVPKSQNKCEWIDSNNF